MDDLELLGHRVRAEVDHTHREGLAARRVARERREHLPKQAGA